VNRPGPRFAGAAKEAALDPDRLQGWCASEEITLALGADMTAARRPAPAADALDHKLGGPREERRYTAPSYEIVRPEDGVTAVVPGFNPVEAYEVAIANLAPGLERRPKPGSVEEVLTWAGEPLATAEVAAVMQVDATEARVALGAVAVPHAAGADFSWTLDGR